MADTDPGGDGSINYNPLRFNKVMLQKLDDLLPEFKAVLEELKNFRKEVGNGEMEWWPKNGMEEPGYE